MASGSVLMNASVVVSLTDRVSRGLNSVGNRFDMIDKRSEQTRKQLEKLDRISFLGLGTTAAGAAGLTTMGAAAQSTLDSAGKLQDVMTSFRSNAFGQAILPNAPVKAVQNVIDQAQKIADSKGLGIQMKFTTKDDAMSFITKQADILAQQLGNDTVFGRKDALAAFDTLQKNGVAMESVLSGAGKATLFLAQISKQAPVETAETVSKMASAYQLAGKQVEDLADVMVKVDGASSATVQSMATGFKYAGGTAKNLGLEYQDLIVALGSLNSRGVDESTAGTALNNMLLALAAPSDKAQSALKRFGLSVKSFYGADGKLLPMQQVIEKIKTVTDKLNPQRTAEFMKVLFGEEGARAATALLQDGAGSMKEIREQMATSLSLTERAAEANKTYTASIQRVQESWDNFKTSMGTPMLDKAANALDKITNEFAYVSKAMQDNPDLSKVFFIGGTAVAGILMAVGATTGLLAILQKTKLVWGTAFSKNKNMDEAGRQADRTKKDFNELRQSAQLAKTSVDGVARSLIKVNSKNIKINVDRKKVDQFVVWLNAQKWQKTVYVNYQEVGGPGGNMAGVNKKGNKGGKGGKGSTKNGSIGNAKSVPVTSPIKEPPSLPKSIQPNTEFKVPPSKPTQLPSDIKTPSSGFIPRGASGALKGVGAVGIALTAGQLIETTISGNLENEIKQHGAQMALSTAGAWGGGALAAALGSIVPGAGTVLGGIIGASAGGWLGSNLGEWIDNKKWTAQAIDWGKNLAKSMSMGMKQGEPEVTYSSNRLALRVWEHLGVSSPTEKGPLRTNHLWGENLARAFADGMVGSVDLLKNASGQVAGASVPNPNLSIGKSGSSGLPSIVMAEGAIQFHVTIDGSKDPIDTWNQLKPKLDEWSRTDLPRHVENIKRRRAINDATYQPGMV
ncbi:MULTISPECIES: phage tail tape measure protein [unclassified Paenibacillus]|uniref:phage tail tape measure protein n=1 Tax=unclassified Paenibacillus TaxID=185978 RepID=UPI003635050B